MCFHEGTVERYVFTHFMYKIRTQTIIFENNPDFFGDGKTWQTKYSHQKVIKTFYELTKAICLASRQMITNVMYNSFIQPTTNKGLSLHYNDSEPICIQALPESCGMYTYFNWRALHYIHYREVGKCNIYKFWCSRYSFLRHSHRQPKIHLSFIALEFDIAWRFRNTKSQFLIKVESQVACEERRRASLSDCGGRTMLIVHSSLQRVCIKFVLCWDDCLFNRIFCSNDLKIEFLDILSRISSAVNVRRIESY